MPPKPSSSVVGGRVSKTNESTSLTGPGGGRFRTDPLGFMIRLGAEGSAFYSGAGWRAYQNYIGARIFYPEYSVEIRNALMSSERIRAAVKQMAEKRLASQPLVVQKRGKGNAKDPLKEAEADIWAQALKIIDGMVADMNKISIIRFVAFTVNNILVRMYHQGVHIRESEFVELRKWAEKAEKEKISLIFLPCHKSHVDYLVISYIFYRLGLALPHIAAGDNLNLPVVGSILKHSGAFFIRRVWGDDVMYNAIMRDYIELLLNRGHNIEAFIEGTRSRIGKLLQPKFGILKIILDSILTGRVKDCYIVPMSIGYDKVIETEGYVRELLGTPKEKESLYQLLNNANILQFKWGRIDVRFAKPFSLKEYVGSEVIRRGPAFTPLSNMDSRTILLQTLGYHVLSNINAVSVVMPTALVGTIILTLRGRGVGRDELVRKVTWLKRTVSLKGGNVADFGGKSTMWVVERAIQVLRDLIGQRQDLLEPVYYPVKRFELSFYRNQVIHLFINEAILSTAMYATVKAGGPVRNQRILIYPDLETDVSFISQLLKSEFIYGTGGLRENLNKTIEGVTAVGVFTVEDEIDTNGAATGRRWMTLSAEERRIGRETFDFYCFLLWPFLETYWLSCIACFALIPENFDGDGLTWFDDRVFTNRAQFFGKTLYYEGDLSYLDAVNKETMKNAFIRLKEMGVIQYRKGPAATPEGQPSAPTSKAIENITWVALSREWYPEKPLPSPPPPMAGKGRRSKVVTAHTAAPDPDVKAPAGAKSSWVPTFTILHNNHASTVDRVQKSVAAVEGQSAGANGGGDDEEEEDGEECPEEEQFEPWHKHTPEGKLWELCESIGRFRREGKNRRDTATVAIRVMRLASMAGVLVLSEGSEEAVSAKGFSWAVKKKPKL